MACDSRELAPVKERRQAAPVLPNCRASPRAAIPGSLERDPEMRMRRRQTAVVRVDRRAIQSWAA